MKGSVSGAAMQTQVPGRRGQALMEARNRYVARGVSTAVSTFAERASGAIIQDVDGNRYIDFAGGIGVLNVGHAHAEVVEAVKAQAERYLHTCFSVMMYEPYVELARRLTEITPGGEPKKAMLANSGAEAVENAVKIARRATGRSAVIAFDYGFHGRTVLTMAMTGRVMPYKYGFGPLAPEVYHVPTPYCYRCPCGLQHPGCGLECLSLLDAVFKSRVAPDSVAALAIEPVLGEGGFIVPPPEYLVALRGICSEHGIVLIVDEVQCGLGRTGKMFAIEHSGVIPDIMTVAKSLGAGIPISAVVGRADLMDAPHVGGLGGTYAGNPLGCVAGLKVIELMEREKLPERAIRLGEIIVSRLKSMQEQFSIIGDVRGTGAMMALELVRDRSTKEPASSETGMVLKECAKRGLIALKAGVYDNVIRLLVPLVIEEQQLREGLDILESSIGSVNR